MVDSESSFEQVDDSDSDEGSLLIVDDEDSIRSVMQEILTRAGYKVQSVSEARQALQFYKRNVRGIRLVLIDLYMPEMSGQSLLQSLLRLNPGVKVLIVSGTTAKGEISHALQFGAIGAISKPFTPDQLISKVREVLNQ